MEVEDVSPALQARLGSDGTTGLLALLEIARHEWSVDVTSSAVERFERRLTEETSGLRVAIAQNEAGLRVEMGSLREGLRGEMRDGEARLRDEMRDLGAALREEGRENTAVFREEMRTGISGLRGEIRNDMNRLDAEIKDIGRLQVGLNGEMNQLRLAVKDDTHTVTVSVLRWSFGLWVGQVVATAAIVAAMFRVFAQ